MLFAQAQRRKKALALLLFDLDHFKTINDMHGHAAGDALLKCVAAKIGDLLPSGALAARFGGDEFACAMLFDPAHPDTVERMAERMVSRLAAPTAVDGVHFHVRASLGVAPPDFDCASIDGLPRSADIAMYAAQQAGRYRYHWFHSTFARAPTTGNAL